MNIKQKRYALNLNQICDTLKGVSKTCIAMEMSKKCKVTGGEKILCRHNLSLAQDGFDLTMHGLLIAVACSKKRFLEAPLVKNILLLSVFFSGFIATAQIPSGIHYTGRGEIVDESTGFKISFVHIFNESTRSGAISGSDGAFRMPLHAGDTLVFSAIGYLGKYMVIPDSFLHREFKVSLTRQVYEIEGVSVHAFRNYEDFKYQFIHLDLPQSPIEIIRENLATDIREAAFKGSYEKSVEDAMSKGGVGIGIPLSGRSPLDNQYDRLVILREKERKQRIIDKKYNRKIVYEITRLTDDELTCFMAFCDFSLNYLLHTTEYDIRVKISEKFELYKRTKESGHRILPGNWYVELRSVCYSKKNIKIS